MANSRYGSSPGRARANQACSRGLVDATRKYGRPTDAASRMRMRLIGSSSPRGFQASEGAIGSMATAAASNTVCRTASVLVPANFLIRKCEYA